MMVSLLSSSPINMTSAEDGKEMQPAKKKLPLARKKFPHIPKTTAFLWKCKCPQDAFKATMRVLSLNHSMLQACRIKAHQQYSLCSGQLLAFLFILFDLHKFWLPAKMEMQEILLSS